MSLIRQNKESYGAEFEKHLFEQYKLYVEMADRISARRMLANSFFVGVHTALITAFTVLLKEKVLQPTLLGLTPFIAVILLCFVWWRVVHSYRQLNSGKFKVVHALEQMLPVAPYGICQHSCPLFQAAFGIFSVVGFSRSRSGLSHT